MKRAFDVTRLTLPSTLAITMLLISCSAHKDAAPAGRAPDLAADGASKPGATTDPTELTQTSIPTYQTVEQLNAMPPCTATVEHKETFWSLLKATDGRKFRIGSPMGAQEVWHFVATLKEGQTYEFPGAFLAFENRKFYVTAEEIRAMPPCKATVECAAPCYSLFRTADGKMFVIGDPGSKPEVWRFLGTLEKGQTYALPGAFVEYHIKK
jgi:hypothetical protein